MNKTMKRNIVVSAILTIMLCVSLITGATFALFTSESKVNVAVTSGKVSVVANIENFKASHPASIDTTTYQPSTNYLDGFCGGSADYDADTNNITLSDMVAGDKVTFDLIITNNSTVPVKFKTTYKVAGDQELLDVLDISVGHSTGWVKLDAAPNGGSVVNTLNCYVEMPCSANIQGKTCTISFLVEAVQGNADVDEDNSIIYISNADEFIAFAESVDFDETGCQSYEGKTVYLTSNIDLTGKTFKGIGYDKHAEDYFMGTFDGQGHTITGIDFTNDECPGAGHEACWAQTENDGGFATAGLFNNLGGVVKNVTISGAKITSAHYAGGIAAFCVAGAKIENCHVVDSEITSYTKQYDGKYVDGDKAGGIAGIVYGNCIIDNCSVKNTAVKAYRDLGALVGCTIADDAGNRATVTNCEIKEGVTIIVDRSHNYKNYAATAAEHNANHYIGRNLNSTDTSSCSGEATIYCADVYYFISDETELFAFASEFNALSMKGVVAVFLTNNITLTQDWTPMTRTYNTDTTAGLLQLTFDGGDHTIGNVKNGNELRQGGFFGEFSQTGSSLTIKNLKLSDVSFKGDYVDDDNHEDSACGSVIAWVANATTVSIENVEVKGIDISGFKYSGGIVGFSSIGGDFIIDRCAVIGTETMNKVNSKNHAGGILGYASKQNETDSNTVIVKNSTIKNIAVGSTDSEKGREGAVVGSLQAGCNVNNITVENVTVQGVAASSSNVIGSVNNGTTENVTITND